MLNCKKQSFKRISELTTKLRDREKRINILEERIKMLIEDGRSRLFEEASKQEIIKQEEKFNIFDKGQDQEI